MRTLLIAALASILVMPMAMAGFTLEWDAADPSFGNVEYTVQKKVVDPATGNSTWQDVATTTATVMGFSSNPAPGDEYRLKITNTDNGVFTYDPNIVKPHPPSNLNFRLKATNP